MQANLRVERCLTPKFTPYTTAVFHKTETHLVRMITVHLRTLELKSREIVFVQI